jgi:hypothetical protein
MTGVRLGARRKLRSEGASVKKERQKRASEREKSSRCKRRIKAGKIEVGIYEGGIADPEGQESENMFEKRARHRREWREEEVSVSLMDHPRSLTHGQ